MASESPPPAPAVVAVVVTSDPGPWFTEALASLAAQDYPNLSVLVIDAGGDEDLTAAVATVMPGAFVRRLDKKVGFGTAANEVLDIVEGASHYLFCHDDVALDPDALRVMVGEAFRSNAGIVCPKYVQWDDPERLLSTGLTTDKVGARRNPIEAGELDQEQHDAVREVLVAPSGATLVRADLFSALGGFDEVVDSYGEDLDLSWRARLLGARVLVVPAGRARHMEARTSGMRPDALDPVRRDRNRYRTLLTCYRWYTLMWIVPLAIFWALGEALTRVLQGHVSEARSVLGSLSSSVRRPGQLMRARRRVQRRRTIGDGELRALQIRGNAKLRVFVQSRVDDVRTELEHQGLSGRPHVLDFDGPEPDADGRAIAPPDPVGLEGRRLTVNGFVLALLLVVFIIGTRTWFGRGLPQVGTLPNTSIGWTAIWRSWWSAWQPGGLGAGAPASPAMALLGLLGTALFGAVGTLQHLVVLGPLVVGPLGAFRAARWWGSRRGQVAAAVVYAIVPLPYNALAGGHWDGLIVYAAVPWVLSRLARMSSVIPVPPTHIERLGGRIVGLALLVAAVASVAPSFLYVVPIAGAALLAGSWVTGRPLRTARILGVAVASSALAFLLLLPWSASAVATKAAVVGVDPGPAGRLGLGQVLRFATGPYGTGGWEWLLLVAAALPLFIGREWRLEWAARLWVLALVFFGLAWAARRGWVPAVPVDVLLAPAAAGLAGSTALGVAAFEMDLPGYNFGWRQAAAALAGICVALASVPWLVGAGNGRWDLPSADASAVLPFLPSSQGGDYRVLWVGATDALPLAGRQLEPGFAYGTSFDGEPALADDWADGPAGASDRLASDLLLTQGGLTTKLGHLLAPAGVKYIVVPNHVGPAGAGGPAVPVPGALLAGLGLQTDLQAEVVDPAYSVYVNSVWTPVREVLPDSATGSAAATGTDGLRALQHTDLSGAVAVLIGGRADGASGEVPAGQTVFVGESRSAGWRLTAGGHSIAPQAGFEWGMTFAVPAGPATGNLRAHLGYSPPFIVRAGYIIEILLWGGALALMVLSGRALRRSSDQWPEIPNPAWFAHMAPPRPPGAPVLRPRRPRSSGPGPGGPRPSRATGGRSSDPDEFDLPGSYDYEGDWPDV